MAYTKITNAKLEITRQSDKELHHMYTDVWLYQCHPKAAIQLKQKSSGKF